MEDNGNQPEVTKNEVQDSQDPNRSEDRNRKEKKSPMKPRPRRPITLGQVLDPELIEKMYKVAGGRQAAPTPKPKNQLGRNRTKGLKRD